MAGGEVPENQLAISGYERHDRDGHADSGALPPIMTRLSDAKAARDLQPNAAPAVPGLGKTTTGTHLVPDCRGRDFHFDAVRLCLDLLDGLAELLGTLFRHHQSA